MKPAIQSLQSGGVPILLAAGVNLSEPSGAVIPDLGLLQNQYRQPMVIDEINIILKHSVAVASGLLNFGGSVRVKLDLGRIGITSGSIPVWLFGPIMLSNSVSFSNAGKVQSENIQGQNGVDVTAIPATYSRFRWKLPAPLFISPGQVLVPSFSRTNESSPVATVRATISYSGRRLPDNTPVPRQIAVPYVASFIGKRGATAAISADTDLYNAFMTPLHIQRFVGRLQRSDQGGAGALDELQSSAFVGSTPNPQQFIVKMSDARGRDVIREYTTWPSVFNPARRSWTAPSILLPRDRYTFYYSAPANSNISPMVSLIGWREEALHV